MNTLKNQLAEQLIRVQKIYGDIEQSHNYYTRNKPFGDYICTNKETFVHKALLNTFEDNDAIQWSIDIAGITLKGEFWKDWLEQPLTNEDVKALYLDELESDEIYYKSKLSKIANISNNL